MGGRTATDPCLSVCLSSVVCLSVVCLAPPPPRPTRDPPQQMGRSMDRSRIDPGSIQDFIIFYTCLLNFTLKFIKYTFWPGILPLQGSPTGQNNVFFIIFYADLHEFAETSITCTFWPGILPLQGSPTGKTNGRIQFWYFRYHFEVVKSSPLFSGLRCSFFAAHLSA